MKIKHEKNDWGRLLVLIYAFFGSISAINSIVNHHVLLLISSGLNLAIAIAFFEVISRADAVDKFIEYQSSREKKVGKKNA